MGKKSNEPIESKTKEPIVSKGVNSPNFKDDSKKGGQSELRTDTYVKSFTDKSYKFQKFSTKKRCSRCEQLNAFSCEHNVVVRESMRLSFEARGKFYTSPAKDRDPANNSFHSGSFNSKESKKSNSKNEEEHLAKVNRERVKKLGKPESLIPNTANQAGVSSSNFK